MQTANEENSAATTQRDSEQSLTLLSTQRLREGSTEENKLQNPLEPSNTKNPKDAKSTKKKAKPKVVFNVSGIASYSFL